ncbi:hypothetical protein CU098_008003 [Rhizopus stolonifer]|uniref:Phospholipid:diacylglycerol acyltransferase n=1 Tax=Rhizopus stolonifer TaxID=4846 RepID=A0A367KT99_RHIST|nr:hypothetical protein CU098_008003 [Rhizopus stolonifer]
MGALRKRKTERRVKVIELPEDILADAMIFDEARPFWSRKRFNFIVGLFIGLLAMYAASTTPVAQDQFNSLQDYLLLQLADIDLAHLLPATELVDEFLGNFTSSIMPTPATEASFMPALQFKESYNLKPHYPVVMIPGVISTGLESWGTSEQSRKYFRKRLWGTMNKEGWTKNVMLDPDTGLDPPGYKVRAVSGVEAADYFVTGYWVWAKVIENLAVIGYDTNNMHFASYDWRLSFSNLEVRDGYFSKLKSSIELYKKETGYKTVIITHSMGGSMFPYFLKWVESKDHGKGGEGWADNHIESFVSIAAPLMGVPKAYTALLSGETRDTMTLGSFGAYILERFFSRRERANLLRTWMGGASMLPKGGRAIWGHSESAPDDEQDEKYQSYGNMVSFVPPPEGFNENSTDIPSNSSNPLIGNFTVQDSLELLVNSASANFGKHLYANYSFGVTTYPKQLKKNDLDPTKWSNPLESRLPKAPNMKIFCLYGVDVSTERSYYYSVVKKNHSVDNGTECTTSETTDLDSKSSAPPAKTCSTESPSRTPSFHIDATISDPVKRVETGIRFSDGDGTVPLMSLGYMCAPSGGWRKHANLYNPGHCPIVLREYKHEVSVSKLDVRGGHKAADHLDILGNWEMTLDILLIVSGKAEKVTERIYSNIEEYAKRVDLT